MMTVVIFWVITCLCADQISALTKKLNIVEEHWKYRMSGKPRIVNGETAEIKDYPYVVMVFNYNTHMCGGSLYSSVMVLSAAHCFFMTHEDEGYVKLPANNLAIVMGTTNRLPEFYPADHERRGVLFYYVHENYDPESPDYDIAALRISHPVQTSPTIQFVNVLKSNELMDTGTLCTALGWGNDSPVKPELTRSMTDGMRKVDLRLISLDECYDRLRFFAPPLTTRNVCTYEDGKDACTGDSGGPLVCNDKQVGIVSYGYGCAWQDLPGIFYAVNDTPWLNTAEIIIWESSSSPASAEYFFLTMVVTFLAPYLIQRMIILRC